MDTEERRSMEAAMAKISGMKREVEANPAASMQASLDASVAKSRNRLLLILLCLLFIGGIAVAIYVRGRG